MNRLRLRVRVRVRLRGRLRVRVMRPMTRLRWHCPCIVRGGYRACLYQLMSPMTRLRFGTQMRIRILQGMIPSELRM